MSPILEEILSGKIERDLIARLIHERDLEIDALASLAISNKQPQAWRAAWILQHIMEENDEKLNRFIPDMISNLRSRNDGHQRELMKVLIKLNIDQDLEGNLYDECLGIWERLGKSPSVRYMAIKILIRFAEKYPELIPELKLITQEHYLESLSPGIKNAIKRLIKRYLK